MPPKRVVWNLEDRNNIISELYNESGYRGRQGTYTKVALHYWFPHQYWDVENFVKPYDQYQRRRLNQVDEELHPMLYSALWQKVGLDVVHMPKNTGFSYFMAIWDDFSGWVEAKAIRHADAKSIVGFIYE